MAMDDQRRSPMGVGPCPRRGVGLRGQPPELAVAPGDRRELGREVAGGLIPAILPEKLSGQQRPRAVVRLIVVQVELLIREVLVRVAMEVDEAPEFVGG